MNQSLQSDRFCMSAGGDVYLGIPLAGTPDVHDLIVAGDLEKALSTVSKGNGGRVLDGVRGDNLPLTVPIPKVLLKSRTWSGHPIRKRLTLHGMRISIENPAGSYRSGTDSDGKPWRSLLHFDYGYILGTVGFDLDHVDCFLGPNQRDSQHIFIIHQRNVKTGRYDEDKVMLGWLAQTEAVRDYLKNYDRRDMYLGCTKMGIDEFKLKAPRTNDKPRKITSGMPMRKPKPSMMIKARSKASK